MSELDFFENTSIQLMNNDVFASVKQIVELYDVPERTLYENIQKLKEDGLIVGAEIRNEHSNRKLTVYNIDEIISIGFRLRSEIAIKFQKWAREIIKKQLLDAKLEIERAQLMESIAWNHLDAKENHRR